MLAVTLVAVLATASVIFIFEAFVVVKIYQRFYKKKVFRQDCLKLLFQKRYINGVQRKHLVTDQDSSVSQKNVFGSAVKLAFILARNNKQFLVWLEKFLQHEADTFMKEKSILSKVFRDVRIRKVVIGQQFPVISQASATNDLVKNEHLKDGFSVSFDYSEGDCQIIFDTETIFGIIGSFSITLKKLKGQLLVLPSTKDRILKDMPENLDSIYDSVTCSFLETPDYEIDTIALLNGFEFWFIHKAINYAVLRYLRESLTCPNAILFNLALLGSGEECQKSKITCSHITESSRKQESIDEAEFNSLSSLNDLAVSPNSSTFDQQIIAKYEYSGDTQKVETDSTKAHTWNVRTSFGKVYCLRCANVIERKGLFCVTCSYTCHRNCSKDLQGYDQHCINVPADDTFSYLNLLVRIEKVLQISLANENIDSTYKPYWLVSLGDMQYRTSSAVTKCNFDPIWNESIYFDTLKKNMEVPELPENNFRILRMRLFAEKELAADLYLGDVQIDLLKWSRLSQNNAKKEECIYDAIKVFKNDDILNNSLSDPQISFEAVIQRCIPPLENMGFLIFGLTFETSSNLPTNVPQNLTQNSPKNVLACQSEMIRILEAFCNEESLYSTIVKSFVDFVELQIQNIIGETTKSAHKSGLENVHNVMDDKNNATLVKSAVNILNDMCAQSLNLQLDLGNYFEGVEETNRNIEAQISKGSEIAQEKRSIRNSLRGDEVILTRTEILRAQSLKISDVMYALYVKYCALLPDILTIFTSDEVLKFIPIYFKSDKTERSYKVIDILRLPIIRIKFLRRLNLKMKTNLEHFQRFTMDDARQKHFTELSEIVNNNITQLNALFALSLQVLEAGKRIVSLTAIQKEANVNQQVQAKCKMVDILNKQRTVLKIGSVVLLEDAGNKNLYAVCFDNCLILFDVEKGTVPVPSKDTSDDDFKVSVNEQPEIKYINIYKAPILLRECICSEAVTALGSLDRIVMKPIVILSLPNGKTLRLCVESKQDQASWVHALQVAISGHHEIAHRHSSVRLQHNSGLLHTRSVDTAGNLPMLAHSAMEQLKHNWSLRPDTDLRNLFNDSDKFRDLFNLPATSPSFLFELPCAVRHNKNGMGILYVCEDKLCFHAKAFLRKSFKLVIALDAIENFIIDEEKMAVTILIKREHRDEIFSTSRKVKAVSREVSLQSLTQPETVRDADEISIGTTASQNPGSSDAYALFVDITFERFDGPEHLVQLVKFLRESVHPVRL